MTRTVRHRLSSRWPRLDTRLDHSQNSTRGVTRTASAQRVTHLLLAK